MISSPIVRTLIIPCIFAFVAVSCSQSASQDSGIQTSELPEIALNHTFTITDSEDFRLLQVTDVKTDSENRIYLQDQEALQVYVFDEEGNFLNSIGRQGSGPGEFRSIQNIFIDQNDRLFAFDRRLSRNTVFSESDSSWEADQTFSIEDNQYGIESADTMDNVILRHSLSQRPEPGAFWYEHALSTGHLDTGLKESKVLSFKDMGHLVAQNGGMKSIPFGRTTVLAYAVDGNLYMVWNENFELAIYNTRLELVDSLHVPIPNQPISSEERTKISDHLGNNYKSLGSEHVPDTKPVISDVFIDKNKNIWLQTYDSPEYLVVDPEGTPLGSFNLPEDLELAHVGEETLFALKKGSQGYEVHVFDFKL